MDCMAIHLREAIAVNRGRLPLYGGLTGGASVRFSRALIHRERLGLLVATYFDISARKFQKKGIPVIEEEFVSMKNIPTFSNRYPPNIDFTRPLQKIEHANAINSIMIANARNDFKSVQSQAALLLESISTQPHVYCLYRHMLESVIRCAYFAPIHIHASMKVGYRSPGSLSRQLIKLHLYNLHAAIRFDESIAFIQVQGTPFIFQDVPAIGLDSNRG